VVVKQKGRSEDPAAALTSILVMLQSATAVNSFELV
jgi:hypothetical protein